MKVIPVIVSGFMKSSICVVTKLFPIRIKILFTYLHVNALSRGVLSIYFYKSIGVKALIPLSGKKSRNVTFLSKDHSVIYNVISLDSNIQYTNLYVKYQTQDAPKAFFLKDHCLFLYLLNSCDEIWSERSYTYVRSCQYGTDAMKLSTSAFSYPCPPPSLTERWLAYVQRWNCQHIPTVFILNK